MNRNTEEHFSQIPRADIRRSKFKRPFSNLTTISEGDLIPIYCDEILPGDTVSITTNALIRMATPIYPVMDNCYADFFFFYVPSRLCWEHWVNLMGENTQSYWAPTVEYTTPKTVAPSGGWNVGTIADYMGIPTGVGNIKVNSMPFRAYCKIWNHWFRDENLQQPVVVDTNDATHQGSNTGTNLTDAQNGGLPLKVNKYKDYFTSALPAPQKGPEILLPLGNEAPVYGRPGMNMNMQANHHGEITKDEIWLTMEPNSGNVSIREVSGQYIPDNINGINIVQKKPEQRAWSSSVYADLTDATAATINQLRQAIALQHIFEADARGGSRYSEILLNQFGVTAPDARLQEPEYIGGHRMPININQVIQTSATDTTSPQGNTAAYSLTTMNKKMVSYSSVEHGYIIGLMAIRVDHSYQQGLRRMWTRSDRFSYYHPLLANLGEMPILNQEIYAQGTAADQEVFGYQEQWADYRYGINMITGEMRSQYAQSLDAWHYADYYESMPYLSSEWIKEEASNIDRTIAVQSSLSHQFICNLYFDQTFTRPMPIYSIPGINTI